MPQFPQLEKRICTTLVRVSRANLCLMPKLNPRKNYGNLSRLGASLDCYQTTPVVVVDMPDQGDKKAVRDGARRIVAVDQGYAPRFQLLDEWDCIVLRTPEGGIPSERDIRRWCAATNMARKNWLPIEKAIFYQQEIDEAIQDRIREFNQELPLMSYITVLRAQDEKKIRKATKEALANLEGRRCDQTIQNHLLLLELPSCIQEQLFKGNISQDAALRFRGMEENKARIVLKEVAKQDKVDLTASQIPGDVLAPTEIEKVEDVFMSEETPWFVPAKVTPKENPTRTIRAKAVDQIKNLKGFEGRKSHKKQIRTVGEIQEAIDNLINSTQNLSQTDQLKLKIYRWVLRENQNLPR